MRGDRPLMLEWPNERQDSWVKAGILYTVLCVKVHGRAGRSAGLVRAATSTKALPPISHLYGGQGK